MYSNVIYDISVFIEAEQAVYKSLSKLSFLPNYCRRNGFPNTIESERNEKAMHTR